MKRNIRDTIYTNPFFIDGIDIENPHRYTYKQLTDAESKNHNPDIQYSIYRCLRIHSWIFDNFDKDAKTIYQKNKKYHNEQIKKEYIQQKAKDTSVKYLHVKNNYIKEITTQLANKTAETWLEKAFNQEQPDAMIVFARKEIIKFNKKQNGDIYKAITLLEKALQKGSPKAAEYLIPIYLNGDYNLPKDEKRANKIINMFPTDKYKFHLSKDKTYCTINKIDKILVNNNELCNRMVELYDQMAQLKEYIDSLIAQGKTYYKGYKITGEISFYLDEPINIEGIQNYDSATSDWKLIFDEKPLPNKIDALDFWKNHNKHKLEYISNYICRTTHDFIYPKNKKTDRNCNYIPLSIFETANPNNFQHEISLTITKHPLNEKKLNKNSDDYLHYRKYYHGKEFRRNLFWFEKKKILKIARKMLEYEFEINSTGQKIIKDLEKFVKEYAPQFDNFYYEQKLNYKFSHPFGIITKRDAMFSQYVNNMMNISSCTMGSENDYNKENYSDNWLEFFWEKPYRNYHLGFVNHSLWDHCNLGTKDILKMNLKNFSPYYELEWIFSNTPEE